ncbi:anion exchange protein 2, slc4a2 [Culex quinquefasciatus]|uniref:Anion exchange protein 2, slc4a2 n=1 Tax=Culex quinquefasciatus TaxID=7176 RepID=B0XJ85_CULQU|nr:anion exchange protein 2, slc4a2 [Culex quinquefasciatus]|eukprot:XP_001869707.1 anion exchange protein 2, slc4a2 [Culex quinquefasciatus]
MEQIVTVVLIHTDDKPVIMRALLLRHRHVNGNSHGGFHFGPNQKYSSYSSIQSVDDGHGETKIDGARRAVGNS